MLVNGIKRQATAKKQLFEKGPKSRPAVSRKMKNAEGVLGATKQFLNTKHLVCVLGVFSDTF